MTEKSGERESRSGKLRFSRNSEDRARSGLIASAAAKALSSGSTPIPVVEPERIAFFTSRGFAFGVEERYLAATPATIGEAMEVPSIYTPPVESE